MASYDARINVTANTRQAATAIEQLQDRLERVNQLANVSFDARFRISGLDQALRTVNEIENAVLSLRSQVRSISAPGAGAIGDAFRVAATEANRFFDSLSSGQRYLSNTISGLNEQSRAFANLAANINSADRRFTDYIQGAQAAQDKGLQPLFRQFEALRRLYQEGITGLGTSIQSRQVGVEFFEQLRSEVPNTTRALQAYSSELERILGLVEAGSATAIGVEQELIRVERALLEIEQQRLETRSALNRETTPQIQSALSSAQGRGANPFGIPDEQVNEVLNNRAEAYVRQNEELSRVMQTLAQMEGRATDPFSISDQQVNAGLEERARLYSQQVDELNNVRIVLEQMEGKRYDPLGIADEQVNAGLNERAALYERQSQELSQLMRSLASMEGRRVDPFGISDQQINSSLDQRAANYETQIRETEALQQALQRLESRAVDWGAALGIDASDVAAERARELANEWNKLQSEADAVASKASEAAAALNTFEFKTRAADAEAYSRALLNLQSTFDSYVESGGRGLSVTSEQSQQFREAAASAAQYVRSIEAASGLGYGGEVPALRPAGFTDQDVRIKNLIDDETRLERGLADTEIDLDRMVADLQIQEGQRVLNAALDDVDKLLADRIRADDKFWAEAKKNLDENDRLRRAADKKADQARREAEQKAKLPFLEQRFGKRGGAAISEGLVGGAFPLLFGQGIGSSIGGGVGGAIGGFAGGGLGFGLSLVGTALGAAFDAAVQGAKDLGEALKEPVKSFDVLKERAILSSIAVEKQAEALIEAGAATEASILIQRDLNRRLGVETVRSLQDLSSASDELARATAGSTAQLQNFIASMIGLAPIFRGLASGARINELQMRAGSTISALREEGKIGEASKLEEVYGRTRFTNITPEQYAAQLSVAIDEAERSLKPIEIKIDPKELEKTRKSAAESLANSLGRELEIFDIGKQLSDQGIAAAREQESIRQQAQDAEKAYWESIGDIRLGVERTVQQQALENIRAQNDLYSTQGEIRLQQLRNSTQALASAQGSDDYGRRLLEIIGDAAELELSAQQQREDRERQFQLEMQSKSIETEIYKADIAKQVAKLNENASRTVADINKRVLERNQDYDASRFSTEKNIARIRLLLIKDEAERNIDSMKTMIEQYKSVASLTDDQRMLLRLREKDLASFERQKSMAEKASTDIEGIKAPQKLSGVSSFGGAGISTAEYDSVREKALAASKALLEADNALAELAKSGKWQEIKEQLRDLADQGFKQVSIELEALIASTSEGGDKYSATIQKLQAGTSRFREALNALSDKKSNPIVDAYKNSGLGDEAIRSLLELGIATNELSAAQIEGTRTAGFYVASIGGIQDEIGSLTEEIRKATETGTAYDIAMRNLAERGLSSASEEARALLAEAQKLDTLKQRAEAIRAITFASEGFTDSMKLMVEQFIELKDAGDAVEAFSKDLGKKSLSFVLDLAFKPIEEGLRTQMITLADKMGVNVRTPQERMLKELVDTNASVDSISSKMDRLVNAMPKVQPMVAPRGQAPGATPGATAGGPSEPQVSNFSRLETPQYIDYLNKTSEIFKEGFGRAKSIDELGAIRSYLENQALTNANASSSNLVQSEKDELYRRMVLLIEQAEKTKLNMLLRSTGQQGMTGQGGPNGYYDANGRWISPMDGVPPSAQEAVTGAANSLVPGSGQLGTELNPMIVKPSASATVSPASATAGIGTAPVADAMSTVAEKTNTSASQIQGSGDKLLASLGKATTGLAGIAAGVIGVTGGMQQISGGGTYETLMGLAGIFSSISTVTGMFGTGGVFSGAFGGGGGGGSSGGSGNTGSSPPAPPKTDVPLPPARALGGPVMGNSPYLVGEQGPELFVPSGSGMIIPNRNRNGGGANPFAATSQQVESYSDRAAMMNSDNSPIKIDSRVINGVEYVTMDQLKEAARQAERRGAEKGRSLAISSLKNSVGTRKRVGI